VTDWHIIADHLARSLRAMPCRDQHGPWTKQKDGSVTRPVLMRCSRCLALELYDAAMEPAPAPFTRVIVAPT